MMGVGGAGRGGPKFGYPAMAHSSPLHIALCPMTAFLFPPLRSANLTLGFVLKDDILNDVTAHHSHSLPQTISNAISCPEKEARCLSACLLSYLDLFIYDSSILGSITQIQFLIEFLGMKFLTR